MSKWSVGQQVVVRSAGHEYISIIERITPSGRVIVGNLTFNPNGTEYGKSREWRAASIDEATPGDVDRVRWRDIRRRLVNPMEVNQLTGDQLDRIAAILDEQGGQA